MNTRKTIFLSLAACTGVISFTLAPAAFARPAPLSPVADVCRTVVGLEPGQAQFEACSQSLGESLSGIGAVRAIVDARAACVDRGMTPGTAALAVCAVQGEGAATSRPLVRIDASAAPAAARSWFYASNGERRQRERLACASLGLDPTSAGFDSCVAGLAASLFGADNPQP